MSDRCWDCGAHGRPLTSTGLAPVKRTHQSYGQGSAMSTRSNPDEVILLRALPKNEEAAIDCVV